MNGIDRIAANLESHLAITILAALGAIVVACGAIWGVRSARRRGLTGEQAGTLLAAAIATGVSAQGMWVFFDKSLHLTLSLRIMFFAFLEIMVLTSALRARSAQQVSGSAGIDGIAMWVLTCLSAVLAATDADNAGTLLIRLSAPLVAAWGWERSMALERRRSGALGGINWRITPERILIRLGIADPTDRTAGEAARQRRLIDVALAADHARTLRETGAGARRINRARRRLQRVMRRAVEDGGLVDNARSPRTVLMDNLRVLSGTGALVDLDLPSPWIPDDESATADADMFLAPALRGPGAAAIPHPATVGEVSPATAVHSPAAHTPAESLDGQQIPAATDEPAAASGVSHRAARIPSAATRTTDGRTFTEPAQTVVADRNSPSADHDPSATHTAASPAQPATSGNPAPTAVRTPGSDEISSAAPARTPGQPLPAPLSDQTFGAATPAAGTHPAHPTAAQTPAPDRALAPTAAHEQTDPATMQMPPIHEQPVVATPTGRAGQALPATPPEQPPTAEQPSAPTGRLPVAESVSEAAQPNRQYRRDPAFRERVRELQAINTPTSEIADRLGTSSRTIRRILADLDAESDTSGRPRRNPAQAAVSNWHNGFRVLPGGNSTAAPGSGVPQHTAGEQEPDRSLEK